MTPPPWKWTILELPPLDSMVWIRTYYRGMPPVQARIKDDHGDIIVETALTEIVIPIYLVVQWRAI